MIEIVSDMEVFQKRINEIKIDIGLNLIMLSKLYHLSKERELESF